MKCRVGPVFQFLEIDEGMRMRHLLENKVMQLMGVIQ